MVKGRRRLGLPLKAAKPIFVPSRSHRQQLECYFPIEPRVLGKINFAHTTLTKLFQNSVMRDCFSIHGCVSRSTADEWLLQTRVSSSDLLILVLDCAIVKISSRGEPQMGRILPPRNRLISSAQALLGAITYGRNRISGI